MWRAGALFWFFNVNSFFFNLSVEGLLTFWLSFLLCEASFVSKAFRKPGWYASSSKATMNANNGGGGQYQMLCCYRQTTFFYSLHKFHAMFKVQKDFFLSRGQTVSILFISSSITDVTKTIGGIGTLDKHNQRGNSKKKKMNGLFQSGGSMVCSFVPSGNL